MRVSEHCSVGRSQGNHATGLHFTGVNRKTELKLFRPGVNDG